MRNRNTHFLILSVLVLAIFGFFGSQYVSNIALCESQSHHHAAVKNLTREGPAGAQPLLENTLPVVPPNRTADDGPKGLSILMNQCSRSTATVGFVRRIFLAHGIDIKRAGYELLNPPNHPFYIPAKNKLTKKTGKTPNYNQIVVEATNMLMANASSKNKFLIFKTGQKFQLKYEKFKDVIDNLAKMGIKFSQAYRDNLLDRSICLVRDCFRKDLALGYPVIAETGEETDLCDQRCVSDEHVEAYFDTRSLVDGIKKQEEEMIDGQHQFSSLIAPSRPVDTDELMAFENTTDEETFQKSLDAWVTLLSPVMALLKVEIIAEVLREVQNSRTETSQSSVVQNMDEVVAAMKEANIGHYLRI